MEKLIEKLEMYISMYEYKVEKIEKDRVILKDLQETKKDVFTSFSETELIKFFLDDYKNKKDLNNTLEKDI